MAGGEQGLNPRLVMLETWLRETAIFFFQARQGPIYRTSTVNTISSVHSPWTSWCNNVP